MRITLAFVPVCLLWNLVIYLKVPAKCMMINWTEIVKLFYFHRCKKFMRFWQVVKRYKYLIIHSKIFYFYLAFIMAESIEKCSENIQFFKKEKGKQKGRDRHRQRVHEACTEVSLQVTNKTSSNLLNKCSFSKPLGIVSILLILIQPAQLFIGKIHRCGLNYPEASLSQ